MDEIIKEFKSESEGLVQHLLAILEEAEGDFSKVRSLDTYGQIVDRIMGSSQTIAVMNPDQTTVATIGKYAELCKSIGYMGSQIQNNIELYNVTVGILLDGTEMLEQMLNSLDDKNNKTVDDFMTDRFLERLVWLAGQFDGSYRASLSTEKRSDSEMVGSQSEIDALIAHFSKA
ncbi:MAG: hypothetical protein KDD34_09020 [Bdellovibrionales bacterium]|nr:hypothetical protein [Bdellovibrionales bacterium]